MSKRRIRPWDRPSIPPGAPKRTRQPLSDASAVVVDGVHFYSDRFYLHTTIYDDQEELKEASCECGCNKPPPLLDRSALVASLDLKAAILATYTLEPNSLSREFPSLFGDDATVPTLVLHGKRGWTPDGNTEEESDDSQPHEEAFCSQSFRRDGHDADIDDDHMSLLTQAEDDSDHVVVDEQDDEEICSSNPEAVFTFTNNHEFPKTVYFSEVTSSWVPPTKLSTCKKIINADGTLTQDIVSKREHCRGVHHPKFMILFEKSGSVVIVVSTGNLVHQRSIDASWIQRFQSTVPDVKHSVSEFGSTLTFFLQSQTLSTRACHLTVTGFVKRHLNFSSLENMERSFDFHRANVHLIPTVPGQHSSKRPKCSLVGRHAIASIVSDLLAGPTPSIPSSLVSDRDRLIFQTTSFGADWTTQKMEDMVCSYMNNTGELDRFDIVWPTEHFIEEAAAILGLDRSSPRSVINGNLFAAGMARSKQDDDQKMVFGYPFLSSETFNRTPLECLSQFAMFETSVPRQHPTVTIPHFKSVCRLFDGSDYRIRKDFYCGRAEEYYSWFLLTSACLSRGAQGEAVEIAPETASFANFELGVLFTSRLKGDRSSDRVYCWKPSCCGCYGKQPRMIHLPIPFSLRPPRYQEESEEAQFCEVPWFHEVTAGSAACGNMRLTPLGAAVAKRKYEVAGSNI